MQASEKLFLQTVGRFIAERFKVWTAPLIERLEKMERAQPITFTAAQTEIIQQVAATAVEQALIVGRIASADDIARAIAKVPAGPAGKDGEHGADGADGKSVDATELDGLVAAKIADAIAALPVKPHVVGGYIDRAGDCYFTTSDGGSFKVGHVVGENINQGEVVAILEETFKRHFSDILENWPKPKDGKDGFGLDDFDIQFDGERTITLRFTHKMTGTVKEHKLVGAWPIYRGVWREETYARGDSVTHEGSSWIALDDTHSRPGTLNCQWQLANKKGRDGREGKQGPPGLPGKNGRDGRDLTQLGPDGKKWG